MRHWTDDERKLLFRMHKDGKLSQSQMAARLGRSKNSVHRQLASLGLLYNERKPVTTNPVKTSGDERKHVATRAGLTTLPPLPSLMND